MKNFILVIILLINSNLIAQISTGITFTFANGEITGISPNKYYEFDIMAQADDAGSYLGDLQIYINYNTIGFGESVFTNGNLTVDKGTLLIGELFGIQYFNLTIQDNASSRISVAATYSFQNGTLVELPTSATQLLHLSIKIDDESQSAGLIFNNSSSPFMTGQQYQHDLSTLYDPVRAVDIDDSSLPVQLVSFNAHLGSLGIELNWSTASEINNLGFEIYRSLTEKGEYENIASYKSHSELNGHGNTSQENSYSYIDKDVLSGDIYWYKLADVTYAGVKTFHGPIAVEVSSGYSLSAEKPIPRHYNLYQNAPNPFNPVTTINFDIPEDQMNSPVEIDIYNSLGELVNKLYREHPVAGQYRVIWNGRSDSGSLMPSGIYFARLTSGSYTDVIRMTLLK